MIFKGAGFDSSSLRPVSPSNRSILETTIQPLNPTIKNQLEDTNGDYVYDAAGNLTQPGPIGGPYVYDAENHLTSADGVTYTYDGDGNRVMKSNGTIYWYGANSASLEESDLSGNIQRWYYFFNGQRVGRLLPTNEVGFYMTDALGSVRYLGGSATGYRFDYFPFGAPILDSDTGDDRYQFTAKERDAESGLDNFGARFNSSSFGRFVTPDWSAKIEPVPYSKLNDPQSLNLYAYVQNNPLNRADADGHSDYTLEKFKNWITGNGYKTNAEVKGLTVAQTAQSHVGSKDWSINGFNRSGGDTGHPHDFMPGKDKCNEFAGDTLAEAGKTRPEITVDGKTRMADAHELADPNVHIPGLSDPKPLSQAQPGDVIAQEHGAIYGHAGIVVMGADGKLATVSANSGGGFGGQITQNDWGFRPAPQNGEGPRDPAPVVRTPQ